MEKERWKSLYFKTKKKISEERARERWCDLAAGLRK